ncbi:MAG: ankyrin repeat domain-containing protein [Chitinophagaceae bacterium]|nr:MAG: ankyrin repeat domain-containing protein [Chitinophagaceae bacterium]
MSDKPSVWKVSHFHVDADTYDENESYRVLEKLKPVHALRSALAAGADPNEGNALCWAVEQGSITQVKALLKSGASTSTVDERGFTPLHLVLDQGIDVEQRKKVEALVKAGANVNARTPSEVLQIVGDEEVQHFPNEVGVTPAMVAARRGNLELLDYLKEQGATMSGVLHAAVLGDIEEADRINRRIGPLRKVGPITETLLERGMDPNELSTTQFEYCEPHDRWSSEQKVGGFLGDGTEIDGSVSPLHLVAQLRIDIGQEKLGRLLLSRGAEPNVRDSYSNTPLHNVQTVEVAEVLLEAGADPLLVDEGGYSIMNTSHNKIRALCQRHQLAKTAQDVRPAESDLADPDEVRARRARGRFM